MTEEIADTHGEQPLPSSSCQRLLPFVRPSSHREPSKARLGQAVVASGSLHNTNTLDSFRRLDLAGIANARLVEVGERFSTICSVVSHLLGGQ
jgi:hypothetical protein